MPNSTLYAFLLSFLAGVSTLLGGLIIYIDKNKNSKIISKSLSFASGVMICVSIIDLIPNSYNMIFNTKLIFPKVIITLIFITIGILISMIIDKYLPDNYDSLNNKKSNLYKIGIVSMIAIILHNIPEGIATFLTSSNNIKLGIKISIAIALHNIPEGISIAIPIYHSTNNKKKAILYAFVSGMSEVFGSIFAFLFLKPYINNHIMGCLYAIIAGIMIHISCYELLPESIKNDKINTVTKYFIIGVLIMMLSHFIIK